MLFKNLFLLLLFSALPSTAGINDFQDRLTYADKLFENSDYFRAYSEYSLLDHFFPEKSSNVGLKERMARTLFRAGQYSEIRGFLIDHPADTPPMMLLAGASAFRMGDTQTSINYLEKFIASPSPSVNDKKIGTARLILAADQAQAGLYSEAHETLKNAANSSDPVIVESAVKLKSIIDIRARKKGKDPLLAGVFSVIPGMGLFYTGKYIDGAGTLLGGVASGYSGLRSLQNGDLLETGLWATAFLFFYIRNFVSAIDSCAEYNKALSDRIPSFMENDLQIRNLIDRQASVGNIRWKITFRF